MSRSRRPICSTIASFLVFDSHRVKQIDRSSTIFSVLCGLTATHKPEFSRCD